VKVAAISGLIPGCRLSRHRGYGGPSPIPSLSTTGRTTRCVRFRTP